MLWSYINYPIEESQKIGKVLAPTTVVADFEEAIHQSVTDTWANVVRVIGCRSHLGQ
jgi:hypothetical protein